MGIILKRKFVIVKPVTSVSIKATTAILTYCVVYTFVFEFAHNIVYTIIFLLLK